jgi:biopolymer transport protein ExbB
MNPTTSRLSGCRGPGRLPFVGACVAACVATFLGAASAPLAAQQGQQDNGAVVAGLADSAQQKLDRGVEELNKLREQIGAEKLPMSQQLTAFEERVGKATREYDDLQRRADTGKIDLVTLKNEMKMRQDELAYVANILDEYARGFEATVNVCEMQTWGEAVERAKQATENVTLGMQEKFDRQTEFAAVTARRLGEAVGGMRLDGVGVDLQGTVVEGKFAVLGPVALFCSKAGEAGLVVPQAGSARPLIRPLDGAMQAGIAQIVQQGEGNVPLDPSLGAALKALVQRFNIWHVFQKGGPIMWPLLLASVIALATVLERLLFLANERRKRDQGAREDVFGYVERGEIAPAIARAKGTRDFVLRVIAYALEHREKSLANALQYAQARELKRFRRGIPILDTVITLAPLLGLLGTVTGMMGSFSLIGGELSSPGAITGGIAEALIATAFGLGIAIISLLPFNFLNARLEEATNEVQAVSAQLELLITGQTVAAAHARPLDIAVQPA